MAAVQGPPTSGERRRSQGSDSYWLHERSQFLREFEEIFSRTVQVPSRCIAIEGPWGSGRSAVLNAACGVASRSGGLVLRARGGEFEKRTPFSILSKFVESAAALRSGTEEIVARAEAVEALVTGPEAVHRAPMDVSPLFYALVIALRQLGPVLLAVDDADLADRETLAVLQYVVHRLEQQQIWLLVTTRPLHPGVGLRPVDWLLMEPGTRQFSLEALQAESVRAIITEYFGEEPDPTFVAACYDATGGMPLFLNALLPSLLRHRVRPTADMAGRIEEMPVPKITQMVLGRLALLPVAASDLLQVSSVLGDISDPTVSRLLAKIDALAAERAADAASQMELLRPGRPLRFSSPLIRWAIYHDIPTARRSQLHARAAQLLAEHGADEATVAQHLLATEPAGDVVTAERLRHTGRTALRAGDVDLALRCLHRALAEFPPAEQRGSLCLDLAAAEIAQRRPSALSHFTRAIELGVTNDAEVIRVAVALLHALADMPQVRPEALMAVRRVTSRLDAVERDLQIEFELALSMASSHPAQRSRGVRRLRTLLAQPGDNGRAMPQMARTFLEINHVAGEPTVTAEELAASLEAVLDADQLLSDDPVVETVQALACYELLCTDRFEYVDELLHRVELRARKIGHLQSQLDCARLLTLSLLWQGSLTAAEEECRIQYELGSKLGGESSRPTIGLVDVLLGQGRVDEAALLINTLRPEAIDEAIYRAAVHVERGRLMVASGQLEDGLEEFLEAGEDALGLGIVNPALMPWRADAAMVLATLGRHADAHRLADEHLRLAREFGAVRTIGIGLRAVAASTVDLTERIVLLSEAVELLEPSAARLDAALALIELGTALVEKKDKEAARGVLRRGATMASLCGARHLVEEAGTQLRAAGARPRRLGTVGIASLTPAEMRVVRLAAEGKTNQRIADELFVTVKTVEGHLAKAYRKLGVDSRRDLSEALERSERKGDTLMKPGTPEEVLLAHDVLHDGLLGVDDVLGPSLQSQGHLVAASEDD